MRQRVVDVNYAKSLDHSQQPLSIQDDGEQLQKNCIGELPRHVLVDGDLHDWSAAFYLVIGSGKAIPGPYRRGKDGRRLASLQYTYHAIPQSTA